MLVDRLRSLQGVDTAALLKHRIRRRDHDMSGYGPNATSANVRSDVCSWSDCVAKLEGVWRRDWSVSFLPFRHPDLVLRWLLDERIGIDD
jgi:hypothetical protein